MNAATYTGAWAESRALLRAHRGALVAGLALVVANRIAALALPASSKFAIDEVIGKGRSNLLFPLAAVALAGVAVQSATAFGLAYYTGMAAERAVTRLRQDLYAHVLRLPVRTFDTTPTGTFVSRLMTDAEQIRTVLGPGLVQLASSVLTAGLALGVLFVLDAPLTWFLLILLLASTFGLARAFGWFRSAFLQVSVLQAELTSRLGETLSGIRVVKAFAAERNEAHALARSSHQLLRTGARGVQGLSLLTAVQALVAGTTGVVMLLLLVRNVVAGSMTLGELALYVLLAGLLATPLVHMTALGSEVGRALSALQRLHELRGLTSDGATTRYRRPVPRLTGHVTFEDVSFSYVAGQFALQHVSFIAPAGSTTAFVGPSGSGKSTICRLLLAFDIPTLGRVLIDGHDLAMLRLREYRKQLGVVLQEGTLFNGTISDNIQYGRPSALRTDVRRAARLAHCEEFVSRMPHGYDTIVGEGGVQLSSGQRQRVAIARAILADPRLLILDEATSHLDIESEALVHDALRTLRRGRTTFVITHHLAPIREADQIVVLRHGQIANHASSHDAVRLGDVELIRRLQA